MKKKPWPSVTNVPQNPKHFKYRDQSFLLWICYSLYKSYEMSAVWSVSFFNARCIPAEAVSSCKEPFAVYKRGTTAM